jgi:uncharacterized protein (UPF0335 family)
MAKLKTESAEPKTAGDLRKGTNASRELYRFVERLERLDEERGGIVDDMKEVRAEAKSRGFDTKILGMVIRRRKMDTATRQETDDLLETYEEAVRQAEKDEIDDSVAAGSDKPVPQPAAQPAAKKWFVPKAKAAEEPHQTDIEDVTEDAVQAEAARQIGHAADHPEADDGMPAFLRRSK